MKRSIKKVLIVNRGEIAVRISRTLQQMGMQVCCVYSEPDAGALHTLECDEAYPLAGSTSLETYLNQERIFELARQHSIDAIHPGYGFLSENATFARRCQQEGLIFVGPTPEVIHAMGDKIEAKKAMAAAGVPMVPSYEPPAGATLDDYRKAAEEVGYPLLVKAAAGGGGKGMRKVAAPQDLEESLRMAQGEARKAFGDDRVFLERYIEQPRHVEIQIFGDEHGNVVHLGERECSIQRRYQKIIEESPSPAVSAELRQRMGEAACQGARALGYRSAGTVEFLLDEQGRFYFLEVNTRLQVEHPITELVYDQDLVRAQMLVAQGQSLPFRQEELIARGWAMECRLYAEDPEQGFLPAVGRLHHYRPPQGPGIRLDSGVRQGSEIGVHYDPMLAKLVTWGSHREEARQRMDWALGRFVVVGLRNNLHFLRRVINQPEFIEGRTHTHFLSDYPLPPLDSEIPPEVLAIAAAWNQQGGAAAGAAQAVPTSSPWTEIGAWRSLQ